MQSVGHSLVLGYPELEPYLTNPNYFGSTVGRFANRINRGKAVIDGQTLSLDLNEGGKHHLHGGSQGASHRNWAINDVSETSVTFEDMLPDGHMGYPGNLTVTAKFELDADCRLNSTIEAQTDAPTLCNFTTHNYFNLDGGRDIRDHFLTVHADKYLPVDNEGIPTGSIESVEGTPLDFRVQKSLSSGGSFADIDHNFCVSSKAVVAKLTSPRSSVALELSTLEPGVQVYSGASIRSGHHLPYAGIALEPQKWPDAPNRDSFPPELLVPGTLSVQRSTFRLEHIDFLS